MTKSPPDNRAPGADVCAPPPGIYFGIDFGAKRIGIAKGQNETRTASPLTTVRNINDRPDWEHLDKLVTEWRPVGLVVGLPLTVDGAQQALSGQCNSFCKKIGKRYGLPVYRCDERFSSIEASNILAENRKLGNRRRRVQRQDTDKIAAAIILENWLCGTMDQ